MDKNKIIEILVNNQYYTIEDLRYNKNIGIMFSKDELEDFIESKDDLIDAKCDLFTKIPLKTFNSRHIFYVSGKYLLSNQAEYLSTLLNDYKQKKRIPFNT